MPERSTPELDLARSAARAGAAAIERAVEAGVTMRTKADADLVSEADTASERAIVEVIRGTHPDHAVLGEELHSADVTAEHLWIVDPLDGTTNFAHGLDHFAVSIAYYRAGTAECGVVHVPQREEWFTAVRGGGAFHDGERMSVAPEERLADVLVGVGFYYDRGAMMEATLGAVGELFRAGIHGVRRFGTASLDLCQVALGRYGAFFEYELAPWDFAAGRLIVEEAGGRVTTCTGDALPIARSTVLASNGRLHDAMLGIVAELAPS
jgi:myo-inositol-1(or 4)-monophosphatase